MTGTSTKDRDHIERFLGSGVDHPTLALVYGATSHREVDIAESRRTRARGVLLGSDPICHCRPARAPGRGALGTRAVQAKLLLFAPDFTGELSRAASRRDDVELIDLDRLYHGS